MYLSASLFVITVVIYSTHHHRPQSKKIRDFVCKSLSHQFQEKVSFLCILTVPCPSSAVTVLAEIHFYLKLCPVIILP